MKTLALALTLLVLGIVSLSSYRREKRHLANLRALADKAFREVHVSSPEERFVFRGCEAVVQKREETGGPRGVFERTAAVSVSIWATNKHGELFLFKWFSKSPKPYIKHLSSPQQGPASLATKQSFKRTPGRTA